MAWPCITRACCINRYWSELDKADIAVPLVFTKYSDVAEGQHVHPQRRDRPVAKEPQPPASEQESATKTAQQHASAALGDEGSSSSVMRQDFKAYNVRRPERSCKPRDQYHPSEAPFNNKSQYQKDYKPWPIAKKGDHPWIPKASPTKAAPEPSSAVPAEPKEQQAVIEVDTGVEKCEIEEKQQEKKETKEREEKELKKEKDAEKSQSCKLGQEEVKEGAPPEGKEREGKGRAAADAVNRQIKSGSSYRTEFKAYTDVKPVRPIRAKSQYGVPSGEKASLETSTSYSSNFKGVQGAPQDNKQLDRRRIRSLYNEPRKDTGKVEKTKAKKSTTPTTAHSKQMKKAKEKSQTEKEKSQTEKSQTEKEKSQTEKSQTEKSQPPKKKSSAISLQPVPDPIIAIADADADADAAAVSKQSKEMINRLAEGKE